MSDENIPINPDRHFEKAEDLTIAQSDPTQIQDQDYTQLQSDLEESTAASTNAQDSNTQDSKRVPPILTIEEWLEKLRSSDRAFYNIMAMEVWSLAKSMDSLLPGFWSQFMKNRRSAMQEFVERRRQERTPTESPSADQQEDRVG